MKLIKELNWERLMESITGGQEVWDESLYFNPQIYDYAKDNNLHLKWLLVSLQSGKLRMRVYNDEEEGLRFGGLAKEERKLAFQALTLDMFGPNILANLGGIYDGVGHGEADEVLFSLLADMDEKTIKSPLDASDLGLWDWKFYTGSTGPVRGGDRPRLMYDSDEDSWWMISPYIFGVAKNFTYTSPFFNYQTLPKGGS